MISLFQIFSPLIIFIFLNIITRDFNSLTFLMKLIIIFLTLQIFSALIKFLFIGINEGQGIGTLSVQAGSITTFIGALFCFFANYIKSLGRYKLHLLILLLGLVFVVINEKRLGTLIVVGFLIYAGFGHNSKIKLINFFRGIFGIILGITAFIIATTLIPTILEAYSVMQLGDRVFDYLNATYSDGRPIGRLAGLFQTFKELKNSNSLLFGLGPEKFLSTNITGLTQELTFNPVGLTVMIGRFGILGVIMISTFFIYLFSLGAKNSTSRLFALYIIFDFIIYSNSIFLSYAIVFLYSIFLRIIYLGDLSYALVPNSASNHP